MMCWSYSGYIYRRCKHIGFLVFRRCIMYYMYCTPFPSCVGLWIATRGKCIVATSHTAPSFNKNHMKIENFLSFLLLNSSSWANPIVFERLNKQQRLFIISNNFLRISFSKANSDCQMAIMQFWHILEIWNLSVSISLFFGRRGHRWLHNTSYNTHLYSIQQTRVTPSKKVSTIAALATSL